MHSSVFMLSLQQDVQRQEDTLTSKISCASCAAAWLVNIHVLPMHTIPTMCCRLCDAVGVAKLQNGVDTKSLRQKLEELESEIG